MIDTIKKYQIFDITLLSIIALISEITGDLLHSALPGAGFHLSFSILVGLVAMIRWGKTGALVYVAAGLPMIFLGEGNIVQNMMLYPVANISIILISLLFRFIDRSKLKLNNFYLLIYVVGAYISVSIGKGLVTYSISGDFFKSTIYYLVGQLFNMVMVFLVFLLIKNKEGLLEDMSTYFNKSDQGGHYE